MNSGRSRLVSLLVLFAALWGPGEGWSAAPTPQPSYKSPTGVAFSPDGRFLYVTNYTADSMSVIDARAGSLVKELPVGKAPIGVAVGPDGKAVFVANNRSHTVSVVDAAQAKVLGEIRCGLEPIGLCISPDGKTLYSANSISDDVSVIDVAQQKETGRIKVGRFPTFLAMTPDGKTLLVNNSLSHEPATNTNLTSFVSVIDTASGKVVAERRSPGTMLMGYGIAVSPDGKWAYAVHHRPNFNVTPSQLSQGWIQTNALSVIPLESGQAPMVTVLLDNVNSGAANPYGVTVSRGGDRLYVTHRGCHEVSVIDLPKLHRLIADAKPEDLAMAHVNLGFLWSREGVVRRVSSGGLGPKGVAVCPSDGSVWVANYFTDDVAALAPESWQVKTKVALGPAPAMTPERKGEFLFNSATHCFQRWLSCSSCHPDARADGVNWDLLNDGMTNPKNAKSLVGAWQTPPAMSLGVRASMEVANEKGFLFIQFHQPTKEDVDAVSAYLRSVPFIPSPWHRNGNGSLDEQATRGEKVFEKAGCDACHPPPLYTNLQMFDVGTQGERDFEKDTKFDTPTLLEMHRTAPYLHDGRAATLKEVLTTFNKSDKHGTTSNLSEAEIEDLVAFLMSL